MNQSLLRFLTAGSVDDGKSTLIGRLLYDSKTLMSDQLATLKAGQSPDFAGLVDGLEAEREQGITIDVAYRYFATPTRKYIIADAPGHEQYTRNMVTGASTADAAIVLIDATRAMNDKGEVQLLAQTKRHSAILHLLGIQHIIVAVNKLDLLDYSEARFDSIVAVYLELADSLGIADFIAIPISALNGDNVVQKSAHTPWYRGKSLLATLDGLPVDNADLATRPLLLPVQRVARQDGTLADDFRGYQGRIEQGTLKVGDAVRIEPQGLATTVTAIYSPYGEVKSAAAGENITLTLAHDIDISRGNMLVAAKTGPVGDKNLYASLCWFDERPLNPARRYLLKQTTNTVTVKVRGVDFIWDMQTLSKTTPVEAALAMNDIARVRLSLREAIVATSYAENHKTGAFILMDEATNQTVAAGMIRAADNPQAGAWTI